MYKIVSHVIKLVTSVLCFVGLLGCLACVLCGAAGRAACRVLQWVRSPAPVFRARPAEHSSLREVLITGEERMFLKTMRSILDAHSATIESINVPCKLDLIGR